jgi:hypothetical protein
LLLISLAGCADRVREPIRPQLRGEWVLIGDALDFPLACGSDGSIIYRADGSYSFWGEAGKWRLDGNKLTETMTEVDENNGDRSTDEIGEPYISTITWIDGDRLSKQIADGNRNEFRRCPERN